MKILDLIVCLPFLGILTDSFSEIKKKSLANSRYQY
jgi:hypothetical protein